MIKSKNHSISNPEIDDLEHKTTYNINEFLKYHDHKFVEIAYNHILQRPLDAGGKSIYLESLRQGRMSKIDILGRLCFSPEGRRKKVKIKKLFLRFCFHTSFRIPILGNFFRIITGVLRLPSILRNFQALENLVQMQQEHLKECFTQIKFVGTELETLKEEKADRTEFEALKKVKADRTELEALKEDKAERTELEALKEEKAERTELEALKEDKADRTELEALKDNKVSVVTFNEQMSKITRQASEEDHLHDAMYAAFEDQFRGTREDIKERQKVYLPYIAKVMQQTDGGEILDAGCGRGEWLELLKEEGYEAKGVDINRVMVARSQEIGLNVVAIDVLDYLKDLPASSLVAITGFHIIEHLPFNTLIALFDESLRVLKPGGLVIFETPNPENLIIGTHFFYIDPTHRNPLAPSTMQFVIEQRGFSKIEIKRLHKYSDYHQVADEDSFTKEYIHSEMDFAVIGYKA